MSHTYWDPKGMVKKVPGGYTYYGGNTEKSTQYKERFVPNYDPSTTFSENENSGSLSNQRKSKAWNTYQKRTWYQNHLDHTTPEFEEFPGIHAEWRKPEDFDKSYRKYNSQVVYDYKVDLTTRTADGTIKTDTHRTSDHTKVQKLRKIISEKERYEYEDNFRVDDFFNESDGRSPEGHTLVDTGGAHVGGATQSRPWSRSQGEQVRHPAINPSLCGPSPKETFKKAKEVFPLFWSEVQKQTFRNSKSAPSLPAASLRNSHSGPHAGQPHADLHPYSTRPMSAHMISLRSHAAVTHSSTHSATCNSRRPQSGYERGLSGTLHKNDGWRDAELMAGGKINFYALSFDVLETLTFPPKSGGVINVAQRKSMSPQRAGLANNVFNSLLELTKSGEAISIQDILLYFNATSHPAVLSKRVTEAEVTGCFILDLYRLCEYERYGPDVDVFADYLESDVITDVHASEKVFYVTRTAFSFLFDCYSQSVSNDGYFEQLLMRMWEKLGVWNSPEKAKLQARPYIRRMNTHIDMLK